MTTPRLSRNALAASAAALGALSAIGIAQFVGGASPVLQFTQAQATSADATKQGCADKTPLDDATAAKVKQAALAAVPGATVHRVGHDRQGDGYVAMLKKADGTRVLVHEDAAFKVTKLQDPAPVRGRGHHGERHHGPRPDDRHDDATTPTTVAS